MLDPSIFKGLYDGKPAAVSVVTLVPMLGMVVYRHDRYGGESLDNWLRASIMVGLTIAIGMVAVSQRLVERMQERALACYHLDEQLDQDIIQADQLQALLRAQGDKRGIERRIQTDVSEAVRLADVGLRGGRAQGQYISAIRDPFLRKKLKHYKTALIDWQASVTRRLATGRGAPTAPMPTVDLSNLSGDDTSDIDHLDRRLRSSVNTVDGIVVVILIAVFGGLYVINNRIRRLVSDKNRALQHAFNEIESQRLAMDKHAIFSISDAVGRITYVNDKFTEVSQYTAPELLGNKHVILGSEGYDGDFYRTLWRTISQGAYWHGEIRMRRKDGSDYWTDTTIVPFLDSGGTPYKYIAISSDITRLKEFNERLEERVAAKVRELKLAQEQLLQSEKMASIGQLAAGVAHEINNPVGYINSNIGTLKTYIQDICRLLDSYAQLEAVCSDEWRLARLRRLKADMEIDYLREDVESLIDESQEGLARVRQIVQDLKDFSHTDSGEWRRCDIHAGLDKTLNIVYNEIKYKAEVVKEYGDLPPVECIPSQLNQVFMNLLVNGAQAIEKQGRITIRTGTGGEDDVWVRIEDTGAGIAPEQLKRIFDPFFTTKPVGQGTGLGLALAYGIVKKHGGRIDAQSEEGKGTVFTIRLPVHRAHGDVESVGEEAGAAV